MMADLEECQFGCLFSKNSGEPHPMSHEVFYFNTVYFIRILPKLHYLSLVYYKIFEFTKLIPVVGGSVWSLTIASSFS